MQYPHLKHTPPTVAQELERKAVTELERLVLDARNGKITQAQLAQGIETLAQTVSGLVDQKTMTLIAAFKADTESDRSQVLTRIFINDGRPMVIVEAEPMKAKMRVSIMHKDHPDWVCRDSDFSADVIPSRATVGAFDQVCLSLEERGLTEMRSLRSAK